jgi:hypothetical protein
VSGPVEEYLDRLFDLLAGSGAVGRRALAEAEDHLRQAAAEEERAGTDPEPAARRAVDRFGPPERFARELLAAAGVAGLRPAARRLVSAGWLLGGLGMVAIGVSGVLAEFVGRIWGADVIAGDPVGMTYSPGRCAELAEYFPHAASCRDASVLHHWGEVVEYRVAAGVLGLLALAGYRFARRRGYLARPPMGLVAALGVAAFGLVGAVSLGLGADHLRLGIRPGTGTDLVTGIASVAAAAVLLAPLARALRHWPGLRAG